MTQVPVQSGSGMAPNVAAGLSYVLGFVSGIFIYYIEKENDFVRFHAIQSSLFSVTVGVLWIGLTFLNRISGFAPHVIDVIVSIMVLMLILVLLLGSFVCWLIMLIKAFQGQRYHFVLIGDIAEKYCR